jgi:hypothetical protein
MIKISAIEISIERPRHIDDITITKQAVLCKRQLAKTSIELGVELNDFFLDESTGDFVARFTIIPGETFAGQFRITAWVNRVARKTFTLE